MSDLDDLTAKIEADMIANYGGETNISSDPASAIRASIYARAKEVAYCQLASVAAGNQFVPSQATDLLGKLEWEYKLFARAGDDIPTRQAAVAAAAKLAGGPTRPNIEAILTAMLGADFIAYLTYPKASVIQHYDPALVGNWVAPGTPAFVGRLTQRVHSGPNAVNFEPLGGRAEPLRIGEGLLLEPSYTRADRVVVTDVGENVFAATFARAHPVGAIFTTGRAPNVPTSKRTNLVVLSVSAARDAEVRRRVDLIMSRVLRGTSRWSIVESSGGITGPFEVALSLLGTTPIGAFIAAPTTGGSPVNRAAAASCAPTINVMARSHTVASASSAPSITVAATSHKLARGAGSSSPTISVAATGAAAPRASSAPTITVAATSAAKKASAASSAPTITVGITANVPAAASSAPTINVAATGAHTP